MIYNIPILFIVIVYGTSHAASQCEKGDGYPEVQPSPSLTESPYVQLNSTNVVRSILFKVPKVPLRTCYYNIVWNSFATHKIEENKTYANSPSKHQPISFITSLDVRDDSFWYIKVAIIIHRVAFKEQKIFSGHISRSFNESNIRNSKMQIDAGSILFTFNIVPIIHEPVKITQRLFCGSFIFLFVSFTGLLLKYHILLVHCFLIWRLPEIVTKRNRRPLLLIWPHTSVQQYPISHWLCSIQPLDLKPNQSSTPEGDAFLIILDENMNQEERHSASQIFRSLQKLNCESKLLVTLRQVRLAHFLCFGGPWRRCLTLWQECDKGKFYRSLPSFVRAQHYGCETTSNNICPSWCMIMGKSHELKWILFRVYHVAARYSSSRLISTSSCSLASF